MASSFLEGAIDHTPWNDLMVLIGTTMMLGFGFAGEESNEMAQCNVRLNSPWCVLPSRIPPS